MELRSERYLFGHQMTVKFRAEQDRRSTITDCNYFQHPRDLVEKQNELKFLS